MTRTSTGFHLLRFLWVVMTMLLVMSYMGNLKSSLVSKSYEKPTKTIEEVIQKDMTHHTFEIFYNYMQSPIGQMTSLSRRLLCQTEKKKSIITFE